MTEKACCLWDLFWAYVRQDTVIETAASLSVDVDE